MTQQQALQRIASLLALNTADHRESAHKDRNLIENATHAEKINIATARTLGILDEYKRKVDMHAPRLFYEIK